MQKLAYGCWSLTHMLLHTKSMHADCAFNIRTWRRPKSEKLGKRSESATVLLCKLNQRVGQPVKTGIVDCKFKRGALCLLRSFGLPSPCPCLCHLGHMASVAHLSWRLVQRRHSEVAKAVDCPRRADIRPLQEAIYSQMNWVAKPGKQRKVKNHKNIVQLISNKIRIICHRNIMQEERHPLPRPVPVMIKSLDLHSLSIRAHPSYLSVEGPAAWSLSKVDWKIKSLLWWDSNSNKWAIVSHHQHTNLTRVGSLGPVRDRHSPNIPW